LTNLSRLSIHSNNITDIQALVANPGLGNGDVVDICGNAFDPTPGSPSRLAIEALQDRGVRMTSDLQD